MPFVDPFADDAVEAQLRAATPKFIDPFASGEIGFDLFAPPPAEEPRTFEAPVAQPEPSPLGAGIETVKGDLANTAALISDFFGADETSQDLLHYAEERQKQAQILSRDMLRVEEIHNMGDAYKFTVDTLINQLPMLATLALPGGVGGLGARLAFKAGTKAATAAGTAAAGATDLALLTGETAEAVKETGKDPLQHKGTIAATGAMKAVLDFMPFAVLARQFGLTKVLTRADVAAAKELGLLGRAGEAAKGFAAAAGAEIPTETMQEYMDIVVQRTLTESEGQLTDEQKSQLLNAAVGAGTFGFLGLGRGFGRPFAQPAPAEAEPEVAPQATPAEGFQLTPPPTAETIPDLELEGTPQPLPIRDEELYGPSPNQLLLPFVEQKELDFNKPLIEDSSQLRSDHILLLNDRGLNPLTPDERIRNNIERVQALTVPGQQTPADAFVTKEQAKLRVQQLRESLKTTKVPEQTERKSALDRMKSVRDRILTDPKFRRKSDGELMVNAQRKLDRIEEQIQQLQQAMEDTRSDENAPVPTGVPAPVPVETPPLEVGKEDPRARPIPEVAKVAPTPVVAPNESEPRLNATETERLKQLEEKETLEGLTEAEYGVLEQLLSKKAGEQPLLRKVSPKEINERGAKAADAVKDFLRTARFQTAKPGRAIPIAKVREIARAIAKDLGIPIRVMSEADIDKVDPDTARSLRDPKVSGLTVTMESGKRYVYIMGERQASADAALGAALHEVVGHYGIRSLLKHSDLEQLRQLLNKPTIRATEEHIATVAENPYYDISGWRKILAVVRKALRLLPQFRYLKLTDDEIRLMLRDTRNALRTRAINKYSSDVAQATSPTPGGFIARPASSEQRRAYQAAEKLVDAVRQGVAAGKLPRDVAINVMEHFVEQYTRQAVQDQLTASTKDTVRTHGQAALSKAVLKLYSDFKAELERGAPDSPVTILAKKLGGLEDVAPAIEGGVRDWSQLWGIKVGGFVLTPLQMAQRFKRVMPEAQKYIDIVDRWWQSKMITLAPADTHAEAWLRQLDKEQGAAVGRALLEADVQSQELLRRLTPAEMEAVFRKVEKEMGITMNEDARDLFGKIRESFDNLLNRMEDGMKFDAAFARLGSRDAAEAFIREWNAAQNAKERVDSTGIAGVDAYALEKDMLKIEKDTAKLRNRNYFPHMRFGKKAVIVKAKRDTVFEGRHFKEGQVVSFETYESRSEQRNAVNDWVAEGHDDLEIGAREVEDEEFTFLNIPPGFTTQIENQLGLDPEQIQRLQEIFINVSPGRAFLRHLIRRKNVKGFSLDAQRVYATYMMNAANHLARVEYHREMKQQLELMDARARDLGEIDRTREGMLANYFHKHFKYIMNPGNDLARLRAYGFLYYLGFNAKSAVVNLSQVPMVTYPYLASRYGDARSLKAISVAYKDVSLMLAGRPGHKVTVDEQSIINALREEGLIDESMAVNLAGFAENDVLERAIAHGKANRLFDQTAMAGAWMFRNAEKYNRTVTALAAARLAIANGATPSEAKLAARRAIQASQFEYAKWNRPEFMRGKASVFFLFWQYMQHASYLAFGGHNAGTAIRFWLILAMAAGLQGLPFAENILDFMDLGNSKWKQLTGMGDTRSDIRNDLRELIRHIGLNPDLVMHGMGRYYGLGPIHAAELFGAPIPKVDISGSVSIGRPLPGIKQLVGEATTPEEKFGRTIVEVMGPVLAMPYGLWRATQDESPDVWKKWERAMPTVIKAASRALRIVNNGGETLRNQAELIDYDSMNPMHRAEMLAQFFAFTPSRLSASYERMAAQKDAQNYYRARRGMLMETYAYAIRHKNYDLLREVRDSIREFNRNAPARTLVIGGDTLRKSLSVRQKRAALVTAGLPTERMFQPLFQQLAEANPLPPE